MKKQLLAGMVSALALAGAAHAEIKIAHIYGKTGPFEAYAKQSNDGLMLGLEYATGGTMEVNGEKIVVIEKDTQLKPENGKALLEEAYGDDEVDLAITHYELELGIPATDALSRPSGRLVEMIISAFPALAEKLSAVAR